MKPLVWLLAGIGTAGAVAGTVVIVQHRQAPESTGRHLPVPPASPPATTPAPSPPAPEKVVVEPVEPIEIIRLPPVDPEIQNRVEKDVEKILDAEKKGNAGEAKKAKDDIFSLVKDGLNALGNLGAGRGNNRSPAMRRRSTELLGESGSEDALPPLEELAKPMFPEDVNRAAVDAMGDIGGGGGATSLSSVASSSSSTPTTQQAAIAELGALPAGEGVDELAALLAANPDVASNPAAANALAQAGTPDAAQALLNQYLASQPGSGGTQPTPQQQTLLQALGSLPPEQLATLLPAAVAAQNNPAAQQQLLSTLSQTDPATAAAIAGQLFPQLQDPAVRSALVEDLARNSSPATQAALLDQLSRESDPTVRQAIASSLATAPTLSVPAADLRQALNEETDPATRAALGTALARSTANTVTGDEPAVDNIFAQARELLSAPDPAAQTDAIVGLADALADAGASWSQRREFLDLISPTDDTARAQTLAALTQDGTITSQEAQDIAAIAANPATGPATSAAAAEALNRAGSAVDSGTLVDVLGSTTSPVVADVVGQQLAGRTLDEATEARLEQVAAGSGPGAEVARQILGD
ncbi:MAG: HEAT repeat domain-containing protein [Planctomycetes bacterium]|nr:HEAT repeat domain-containing protein [Planctomycetota bacterium]